MATTHFTKYDSNFFCLLDKILLGCQHCGADVNHLATHGLSCKKSEGRHHRHAATNDILYHAPRAIYLATFLSSAAAATAPVLMDAMS